MAQFEIPARQNDAQCPCRAGPGNSPPPCGFRSDRHRDIWSPTGRSTSEFFEPGHDVAGLSPRSPRPEVVRHLRDNPGAEAMAIAGKSERCATTFVTTDTHSPRRHGKRFRAHAAGDVTKFVRGQLRSSSGQAQGRRGTVTAAGVRYPRVTNAPWLRRLHRQHSANQSSISIWSNDHSGRTAGIRQRSYPDRRLVLLRTRIDVCVRSRD